MFRVQRKIEQTEINIEYGQLHAISVEEKTNQMKQQSILV